MPPLALLATAATQDGLRHEPLPDLWLVLTVGAIIVLICMALHVTVLKWLHDYVLRPHPIVPSPTLHLGAVVLTLLACHLVHIFIFGVGYYFLNASNDGLVGSDRSLFDSIYFSSVTYTTLGFGDITPEGNFRMLTGLNSLAGLLFITWSASFTFLIMQRLLPDPPPPPPPDDAG